MKKEIRKKKETKREAKKGRKKKKKKKKEIKWLAQQADRSPLNSEIRVRILSII